MPTTLLPDRLSPIHAALERLFPRWGVVAGMPVALDFGSREADRAQARTLALCDASALPRVTLKGRGAPVFLEEQGIPAPAGIYACQPLPGGGLVARTGAAEFFIEDGPGGEAVAGLERTLAEPREGVCRVLRQDASLLLAGSEAPRVLAQTCSYDFRQPGADYELAQCASALQMVMTRLAGVSCAVLPRELDGIPAWQMWADRSYGLYLWETLLGIARELRGGPVGLSCFFPELAPTERQS